MNLPTFLRKTDDIAEKLSKEQLQMFVHEIARTLPENKRQYFLETLEMAETAEKENFGAISADKGKAPGYEKLCIDLKKSQKILEEINKGFRCLDSEYNEEWDDWYNSDADEVLFSDPTGLLHEIENAVELIHKCIDFAAYKEGCELAETLSVLEVTAKGDYEDFSGEPLYLSDLYEHELLSGNLQKTVRECLYLEYMGNDLPDRAEEMLCMVQNFQGFSVRLEDVLQTGNCELPEFEQFLPMWIEHLGNSNGMGIKKLLEEAQYMLEDEQQILDTARKYAGTHPELYKQILENSTDPGKNEQMVEIGTEALGKVPGDSKVRSEIALLTAEYARKIDKKEICEYCWLEAFRSHPSVVNYLRFRLCTSDWTVYKDSVTGICHNIYGGNRNLYYALLFWNGEFSTVMQVGINAKEALGWSFTFMKQGIASFLLLLYQGTEQQKGLNGMLNLVQGEYGITAEKFYKGTGLSGSENDTELLWKLICKWKKEVTVSKDNRKRWMNKIENFISMRVDGIMEANRRNYYDECAAFIAAYGEVKESMGIFGAKNKIMEEYRERYPRRRAFIQSLREYGYSQAKGCVK